MTFDIISKTRPFSFGDRQAVFVDIDITSYTTGGEVLTSAVVGLPSADVPYILSCVSTEPGAGGPYTMQHDEANNKVLLFAGATQATSTGDLGTFRLLCVGPRAD